MAKIIAKQEFRENKPLRRAEPSLGEGCISGLNEDL